MRRRDRRQQLEHDRYKIQLSSNKRVPEPLLRPTISTAPFQTVPIQRRRGGGLESPAVSFTRPLTPPSIHPSIHQRFRYFSSSNAESANPSFHVRAFQEEGFYRSPFLKHQNRARRGGESWAVQLSSLFPFPIRFHACVASIVPSIDLFSFLFFSPSPPLPRFYRRYFARCPSVNGISFSLSLSLSLFQHLGK